MTLRSTTDRVVSAQFAPTLGNALGDTLPPGYESISGRTESIHITRNSEKQALRDAWARQDLDSQQHHSPRLDQHQRHQSSRPLQPPQQLNTPSQSSLQHPHPSQERSPRQASTSTVPADPTQSGGHGHRDRGFSVSSGGTLDSVKGILPEGMNIQEALEKCEDPGLGWSLQFWVTIADPVNQHVFFACPANGRCSWDPPVGAFVVPRSPDGEWWELSDSTRGNRSYYYNTLTGKTQWTRPSNGAFVIPLGLIQRNALPVRHRPAAEQLSATSPVTRGSPDGLVSTPRGSAHAREAKMPTTPRSAPRPPLSPAVSPGPARSRSHDQLVTSSSLFRLTSFPGSLPSAASPAVIPLQQNRSQIASSSGYSHTGSRMLGIVAEGSGSETDMSENSGPNTKWWSRRKRRMSGLITSPKKGRQSVHPERVLEEPEVPLSLQSGPMSAATANGDVRLSDSPQMGRSGQGEPVPRPSSPVYVDNVRTKRMSTGLHPLLPTAISSEIRNFQTAEFASKYFATKRSGMLRSKVPLERIMEWQKQPITAPLLVITKDLAKDALTAFKVIQHVMGERDRPVENAKPTIYTSSISKNGTGSVAIVNMTSEKMIILEEIRWLLQLAVLNGEMRDQIYSQLIKQLTKNPEPEAVILGFQLFSVLLNSYPPSQNFEVFVKAFLAKQGDLATDVVIMARYCQNRLQSMIDKGERGRILTIVEIEHASDAAFHPSVYGQTLEQTMRLQATSYPDLKVPVILPFLADGILALGGLQAEGIFRVPGDNDSVAELRARIDRGHYQLTGIDDPHIVVSLLKLWLRETEEPLIPHSLYNAALSASKSVSESLSFVARLPTLHRRVLLFVISFAQLFLEDEVVQMTKMTAQNIALVLAPNILRTTSKDLETVLTNSSFETRFVLQLLEHMNAEDMDAEYKPTFGGVR